MSDVFVEDRMVDIKFSFVVWTVHNGDELCHLLVRWTPRVLFFAIAVDNKKTVGRGGFRW